MGLSAKRADYRERRSLSEIPRLGSWVTQRNRFRRSFGATGIKIVRDFHHDCHYRFVKPECDTPIYPTRPKLL